MSNEGIGKSFSAFSFIPQNGITPILDPRTDSPVSNNNNNTRKSPRPSASPIGSNQDSFFGSRLWETSAPTNNSGTAKSWGTSGPFQNNNSLLSPSSHISDIWSFSLPTFSSDNATTTTAPPPSSSFRSLDSTSNNFSYSRSPNNNLPSPRVPNNTTTTTTTTSSSYNNNSIAQQQQQQQQQHSSSFSSISSGAQAFGRTFTSTPPINEDTVSEDYLGEDISSSPSEYDPTSASDAFPNLSGEHPLGEHPSRTLFVRNINSNLEDEELSQMFEQYGPIRNMYTQCKHRGFVMISYYDIRHAKNAMRYLQGKLLRKRKLDIHYSIPKDNPSERDQNQGTLVVFNLDPSTSNEELKLIFGQFGEIKEIRETPNKKHHKFIEFFDIRDADKAMKNLNKTEIKGKKIKIEPSRPGGRRTPVPPTNTTTTTTTSSNLVSTSAPPVISHHHHLSHSLDNNHSNISSSYSNTSLHMMNNNNNNNQMNNAMYPHSLPDDDLFSYNSLPNQFTHLSMNNSNGNNPHKLSNPFQYSSSDLFGSYSSNYSPPYSVSNNNNNNNNNNNSNNSKGLVASSSLGNNSTMNSNDIITMRNRSQSFSSSDRDLIQNELTLSHNSANNIWSDPFSALSPRGGFSNNSNNTVTSNNNTMSSSSSFNRIGGFSPPAQHITATTNSVISTTPPTFSDLMFENTLRSTSPASKSFEGISDARSRNRSHSIDEDRSKYILSLDRVRNGGDPRTTLMIKNIPNKYSQKMLLATVDEKHKGTYDFFYLPIDFKNKCNVGYAFINFTNPEYIIPFYEDFNNKKWEKFNSEKVCDIAYARIQGKNALISHFQNSSLMVEDKKCRPIIFHDGEPESFPLNNSNVVNVPSPRRSRSSSVSSQGSRDENKD